MGGSGHFGSSSLRKTARSGLPSQWGGDPASLSPSSGGSPPHHTASPGYFPQSSSQPGSGFLSTGNAGDDDIIPTAIVVKNIPFSIKREQLLQIIVGALTDCIISIVGSAALGSWQMPD